MHRNDYVWWWTKLWIRILHYVANRNRNSIHMHCAHKYHTSITNHGTTNHLVNKNRCVVVRIGCMCWLTTHNSHCTYVQTQSVWYDTYNCTTKKIWIHFIEVLVSCAFSLRFESFVITYYCCSCAVLNVKILQRILKLSILRLHQ